MFPQSLTTSPKWPKNIWIMVYEYSKMDPMNIHKELFFQDCKAIGEDTCVCGTGPLVLFTTRFYYQLNIG